MIDWVYPHFTEREMGCKGLACCGGKALMQPDFMMMLESLRVAVDEPLPVTSGYRCPDHNKAVGGGPAHPMGVAADIAVSRGLAYKTLKLALLHGFTGIGINQTGDRRFLHLDTMKDSPETPRPTIWGY